ncbi:CoA transferase [Mesorhizobium sp.]|uniref:CoA transferase n=1 Tax=Mesorhizobium sp. TaxID=1871066 RepID=UPI0025F5F994|nr:CoA transferase [Mesorhizobium sp.]
MSAEVALQAKTGPLAGLTVIEMAGLGPVPLAGLMLSEMGAEVLRIERVEPAVSGATGRIRHRLSRPLHPAD